MYLRKTILASAVALVLASTSSVMAEKSPVNGISPVGLPMVETAPDGLFVGSPMMDNLTVMIVRVYNEAGDQVLNVRSKGEAVDLLATDLPDGSYRYEVKTIIKLDKPVQLRGEFTDEMSSRDAGRFTIKNSEVIQPSRQGTDEAIGYVESLSNKLLTSIGYAVNFIVSPAAAADLTASSANPLIFYNDSSSSFCCEWATVGNGTDTAGKYILQDLIGSHTVDVFTINGTSGSTATTDSWVVESSGNMSWKAGFMNLNSIGLSLGTASTPAQFNISDLVPDIRLIDESDSAYVEWEQNAGTFHFITFNGTDPLTTPITVSSSAPTNSLDIAADGAVSMGVNLDVTGTVTAAGMTTTAGLSASGGFVTDAIFGNGSQVSGSIDFVNDTGGALLSLTGTVLSTSVIFGANGTPYAYDVSAPDQTISVTANGNIGFGTGSPSEALHVQRTDSAARIQLDSISTSSSNAPQMIWRRARSNAGVPAAVQAGDNLGAFSFRGYDGTGYTGSRGFINVQASQNWSGTSHGTQMLFQVTQNDTTAPFSAMSILNNGTVVINGSVLNVPDYVFEEDYDLMSLDQLAEYLKANKHLPGVASAKEVNENGLNLGGSQLSLLEKVEELTLYTLQQHEDLKQMDLLKAENAQLKAAHRQLLTAFHAQQEKLDKVDQLEQMVNQLMESQEGKSVYTSLK